MKKAVVKSGSVIGFVDVDKTVRSIDVAGSVRFIVKSDVTCPDMGIYLPNHFDKQVVKTTTKIVETCINVSRYKVSSDKKYFTRDNQLNDNVLSAIDVSGKTVFYLG